MEAILEHEPKGSRTFRSGNRKLLRKKEEYSFKALWKDLPQDDTNPTWEPWDNQSLRESFLFQEYCARADVVEQLGENLAEPEKPAEALKRKR
jgi:hypothetical protein